MSYVSKRMKVCKCRGFYDEHVRNGGPLFYRYGLVKLCLKFRFSHYDNGVRWMDKKR